MKKLVFFDTETTGNTADDVLCQIAYKTGDDIWHGLFNPGKKIPPEASAVHHITNKMVKDSPAFKESQDYGKVKKLFEDKNSIVVAHNAIFDLQMIKKEDIEPESYICTLRVARELDREGKIDRYNLQYLRYLLDFELDAPAHSALGDVIVLEQLFDRLKKKIIDEDGLNEEGAVEKMIEISSHPSIFRKLTFGKYKGKTLDEVVQIDRGWLEWLLGEKLKSPDMDEDWIYTLKHYLGK